MPLLRKNGLQEKRATKATLSTLLHSGCASVTDERNRNVRHVTLPHAGA